MYAADVDAKVGPETLEVQTTSTEEVPLRGSPGIRPRNVDSILFFIIIVLDGSSNAGLRSRLTISKYVNYL